MSELHTPIGTLLIDVVYRTKMTILPDDRPKIGIQNANNDIMLKSDHFNTETPKLVQKLLPYRHMLKFIETLAVPHCCTRYSTGTKYTRRNSSQYFKTGYRLPPFQNSLKSVSA